MNLAFVEEVIADLEAFDRPEGHVLACQRIAVAKVQSILPIKYIEALEQNQQISSCCRHPENHEIEAFWSSATERDRLTPAGGRVAPDIYIFHCTCGRMHRRFCLGGDKFPPLPDGAKRPLRADGTDGDYERRPFWEVR